MIGEASRRRRLPGYLLFAMLAGTAGLLTAQSAAVAAPDLSTVVLSNTLPGMVAAAPGADNGPATGANLQLLGMSPAAASTLQEHINDGDVAGYIRLWSRKPPNGDAVLDSAFQFQNAEAADAWLAGENSSLRSEPGVMGTNVLGIPGASEYTVPTTTSSGTPFKTYLVFFNKGDISFQVGVGTSSGDLTYSDAIALANSQAANAPASSNTNSSSSDSSSLPYRAGEIFGAVIVALVILWVISALIRRSRRKNPATGSALSVGSRPVVGAYPPPPSGATEPGWIASRTNMNEQFFWNGKEWAGRRHWRAAGAGWVQEEEPVAP